MKVDALKMTIIATSNNMFTLRVSEGTFIGQVRPHHFTGCDHRQDGLANWVQFSDVVNTETLGEKVISFQSMILWSN